MDSVLPVSDIQEARDKTSHTVSIKTHRRMPAAVTKTPPEKSVINPIFLGMGSRADQSIGTGIDSRYKSVAAFSTTVTKMSILEIAG